MLFILNDFLKDLIINIILITALPSKLHLARGLDGRIVDGEDTTIEEFPHQISLRFLGDHNCGGSIIDEYTILTAAHCTEG